METVTACQGIIFSLFIKALLTALTILEQQGSSILKTVMLFVRHCFKMSVNLTE